MLLKSNFITPLLFIGVHFIYNTNVVVTFRTNLHVYNLMRHKKSMAQITAPCPNKKNLIVKIEISDSNSCSGTNLFLVLCILRIKVGPAAHPVGAAIEGSDVGYGVETCTASETCGTKQWASCDRSIAICTNQ